MILNDRHPLIFFEGLQNQIFNFYQTDNEELYQKNRQIFDSNWYYYDKPIEYKFNEWGYRTKNFDELHDDYILTFGCSYTEGVGLLEDDMWATQLSKKLNLDLLNLAKGSSSLRANLINSILISEFIRTQNKPPKLVIYQYPPIYRATFAINEEDDKGISLKNYTPQPTDTLNLSDNLNKKFYEYEFITNGNEPWINSMIIPVIFDRIWNCFGCDVLHWGYESDLDGLITHKNTNLDIIKINPEVSKLSDIARDVEIDKENGSYIGHNGIPSQNLVVETLMKNIKND